MLTDVSGGFVTQVSGYVAIAYVRMSDIIPLRSLRLIRGRSLLTDPSDPTGRGYSLYVADNYKQNTPGVGLKELQLTALRGEHVVLHAVVLCIVCFRGRMSFYPRDAMRRAGYSCRNVSVCLSV